MAKSDCPHCGYSNPIDAHFCVHCGTNLARTQLPPAPAGESSDEPGAIAADQEEDPPRAPAEDAGEYAAAQTSDPTYSRTWPHTAGEEEDAAQVSGQEESQPAAAQPDPLLADLGGLLEPADPLAYTTSGAGALDPSRSPTHALSSELTVNEEERRQLRQLFSEDLPLAVGANPDMAPSTAEPAAGGSGLPRRPWLEWLLLLGLTGALLWGAKTPTGGTGPHAFPGLEQAHLQIDTLRPNSLVLVNWAYDPATAGEMDLVAQPVIEHLLHKQARLIVVSQLPGGPAMARRVIARAEESVRRPARAQVSATQIIEGGFLPGGAASLPLLAIAPVQTLPVDPRWVDLRERFSIASLADTGPALTLVIAARAEDVRRWLEQVQPINDGTVIAVTSAVVDPALRPYLHSGQLAGLVSGWDGGNAYLRRSERTRSVAEQARSSRLTNGQNWGIGILIVVILLGNLAGLTERRLL